jgi:hypothetical protein
LGRGRSFSGKSPIVPLARTAGKFAENWTNGMLAWHRGCVILRSRGETMLHVRNALQNVLVAFALVTAAGCASDHPGNIPGSADMVAEGNRRLVYQAPDHGMIYVYNDTRDKLIYSGEIDRNETITIDLEEDRLMMGAQELSEQDFDPDHRYQVYFDPQPGRSRRVVIEERRVN